MNVIEILTALSKELRDDEIALYICGGAALNLLGISSRETADIDVLEPKLSPELRLLAASLAKQFGLSDKWLNNGPADLLNYLEPGWQDRAQIAFKGDLLTVYALSRQELINSKLWAACDRIQDIPDIVAIGATTEELEIAKQWVLACDAGEVWPDIVEHTLAEIKKRFGDDEQPKR